MAEQEKSAGGKTMAVRRYEVADEQWEQIKEMFPRAKTGWTPKNDRMMLNAMLRLARSGAAWADIPEHYGPHQGVDISGSNILGDKAYGAARIREYTTERGAGYAIPPRENVDDPWPCDYYVYMERRLVECFLTESKLFA